MKNKECVEEIFDYWKLIMNKPRAKMDANRLRKIEARISNGYTVDEIKLAILGCKNSPFHMGENENHQKYNDIELICRHARFIDKFMEIGEAVTRRQNLSRQKEEKQAASVPTTQIPSNVRQLFSNLKKAIF